MIINKDKAIQIYNTVEETKEISKFGASQEQVIRWCHTINDMATKDWRVPMYNGYNFSDFEVPSALSDLIVPRKIAMDSDVSYRDMRSQSYKLYKPELYGFDKDIQVMDALEFNIVSKAILGTRKADSSRVSKVSEYNTIHAYESVKSRLVKVGSEANEWNNLMIPASTKHFIPIGFEWNALEEYEYVQSVEQQFKLWLFNALNSLKGGSASATASTNGK